MSNNKPNTEKFLVVDDEKLMRESVQELLLLNGFNCTLASNGREALQLLSEQSFDIMLLDLIMPEIDGYQVMQKVQFKYPDLDIIITSGEATFNNASQAMRHGVKAFLDKPYQPNDLVKILSDLIEKKAIKRNLEEIQNQIVNSEQRYRLFIEHSPDIVFMLDASGNMSFINSRAMELLNYTQAEFLGCHYSEFIHGDDLEKAHFIFSTHLSNIDTPHTVELRIYTEASKNQFLYFEIRSIATKLDINDNESIGIYGVARDITEKKHLDEMLAFNLYHDALTKLPNRVLYRDRMDVALTQAKRNQTKVALILLDMNRFKLVNDSLGIAAGDKLLLEVAKRLKTCVRDSDTLGRMGGDEFSLMLTDVNSHEDILKLIKKITQILEKPFIINGNNVHVSFSMGTAIFPDDGGDRETLIAEANTAIYHIKGKGNNDHAFFSDYSHNFTKETLSLENEIRIALQEDQFEIYFQPQYSTVSEKISGVEALIRWNHPKKGLIMPDHFIPLAEETHLIIDIGEWVLDASCQVLQQWNEEHPALSRIKMAVNIAAPQINMENFVDSTLAILEKYQILGEQLELEITENIIVADIDLVVEKFQQLAKHGITFAVDDFGMGYSSLSYLQTLPLNNLKIDRAFVSTIRSAEDKNAIVTAIASMAKGLDMHIVAEGVETQAQLDFIKAIGCPTVQGYLLGRPMPTQKVKHLILQQFSK